MLVEITLPSGKIINVEKGSNLRDCIPKDELYSPLAKIIHCRGMGTCGTCAIKIEGNILPKNPSLREKLRLSIPPHQYAQGLRLACQVKVNGNLKLIKGDGMWGNENL